MQDSAGKVRTNSLSRFHTDMQVLYNQLEFIYNSYVRTQYIV